MKTILHIITSLKKVEKKNIITSVVISQDSTFGLKQKISFTYLPKGNKHLALQSAGVIDFPKMSADDFNKLIQAFNDYVFSSWKITKWSDRYCKAITATRPGYEQLFYC